MKDYGPRYQALIDEIAAGASIVKACENAGVSRATFYRKMNEDSDLEALVQNALYRAERTEEARLTGGTLLELCTFERRLEFVRAYSKNGSLEDSCEATNIEFMSVVMALDEESEEYDEGFDEMIKKADKVILARIEDKMMKAVLSNDNREATGHRKWFLERRHGERYGNKVKVEEEVSHTHRFDSEQALKALKAMSGLREEKVIDVSSAPAGEHAVAPGQSAERGLPRPGSSEGDAAGRDVDAPVEGDVSSGHVLPGVESSDDEDSSVHREREQVDIRPVQDGSGAA